MPRLCKKVPIEAALVTPFLLLPELASHEQQLLAGMPVHEGVIGTQVCEPLPVIARHPAEDRTLAVHHFVMRERQDEILEERIVQTEHDVAVMVLAMDRILADVIEGVVPPPHAP